MSINYNSADTANTINRAIDNSMGLTTTDQGASSAGLIIKEDLQPVVQCTSGFDYAVTVKEISGVPPLSFHSMGQVLQWSIDGNTDSGNSVGDKTDNLFSSALESGSLDELGLPIPYPDRTRTESYITVSENENYTITVAGIDEIYPVFYNNNHEYISPTGFSRGWKELPYTFNYQGISYVKFVFRPQNNNYKCMLVTGTVAKPYKPYGYDIPIVVNNTDTYHCYITDVLRKSNGETPVYDTMSSDGTIIRRVDTDGTPLEEPTEETYTAPSVEVPWGNNTVDVDTTVLPSSMYIKYKDN